MKGGTMGEREEAVERLLAGYRRYYSITRFDGGKEEGKGFREAIHMERPFFSGQSRLAAVCEYYEKGEKYFLFHSAALWSTAQEEFLFVFNVPRLTVSSFRELRDFACDAAMDMAHIGPGHMYTYISPVFICDSVEEAARKELEACNLYKTFFYSFHGWMEVHAGAMDLSTGRFHFNRAGKCMEKGLRQVFARSPLWKGA